MLNARFHSEMVRSSSKVVFLRFAKHSDLTFTEFLGDTPGARPRGVTRTRFIPKSRSTAWPNWTESTTLGVNTTDGWIRMDSLCRWKRCQWQLSFSFVSVFVQRHVRIAFALQLEVKQMRSQPTYQNHARSRIYQVILPSKTTRRN